MHFLTWNTFAFLLTVGIISQGPCLASLNDNDSATVGTKRPQSVLSSSLDPSLSEQDSSNRLPQELDDFEPIHKRQRVTSPISFNEDPSLEVDQWDSLPEEIWVQIFDSLSFRDLGQAQQVCKKWTRIGNDENLSLAKQVLIHPLATLLKKVEDSRGNKVKLYQEILASPVARPKLLLDLEAINNMLKNPFLIPLLFESEVAASEIHEALYKEALNLDQQEALEAYTKDVPVYPTEQSIFSQKFVEFTKLHASHYKAFYLLDLFKLPSAQPMIDLFRRVEEEIGSEDVYDNQTEDQAILVPRAMAYFPNIDSEIASYVGEYCYKWSESSPNEALKNEWLDLAEIFYRESARQGDVDAKFELSVLLEAQGRLEEAKVFLHDLANQGDPMSQWMMGLNLENEGKLDEAEVLYYQAAIREEAEAQYHLGRLLKKQGKVAEAMQNYEKATQQGHKFSCLSLAHLLEAHPELFPGSQAELHQRIAQLREQGKASYEAWSKARSI
jgi:TPR repeat protein